MLVVVTVQTHINESLSKESKLSFKRIQWWSVPDFTFRNVLSPTRSANFSLVHHYRINPENIFRKTDVHSGLYIPECVSHGRWSAPHVFDSGQVKKTCFTTFFDCINGFPTIFHPPLPINTRPNPTISHTILSHPLLFFFLLQPWFSIVGLS